MQPVPPHTFFVNPVRNSIEDIRVTILRDPGHLSTVPDVQVILTNESNDVAGGGPTSILNVAILVLNERCRLTTLPIENMIRRVV